MFGNILLSIGIGLTCGIAVIYAWPTLRYAFLKNRCRELIKKFFVRIILDEADKSLSKICSAKLRSELDPITTKIRALGRLNAITKTKVLSIKPITTSTNRAMLFVEAHFQKGRLQAHITIAANDDIAQIREVNII